LPISIEVRTLAPRPGQVNDSFTMCLKRRHAIAIAVAVMVGGGVFAGSAVSAAHLSASRKPIRVPAMGRIIPQRLPPFIAYDDGTGIFLTKPDGSESHQVGPVLGPDAVWAPPTMPSWSPRATRILYQVNCTIWVMRPDGSRQRLLVRARGVGGCSADSPRWSPNGKQIVYTGTGPLTAAPFIRIANADGSQDHLVDNTAFAQSASFSPDGRYIIFVEDDAQTYHPRIYVIRPNGTGFHRITPRRQRAQDPSWSPDGTHIIYICDFRKFPLPPRRPIPAGPYRGYVVASPRYVLRPQGICEISRTHPKPRTLFSLPSGSSGSVSNTVWSADGKKILFLLYDPNGSSGLALMRSSGGTPVVIPNTDYSLDPDW